jgi:hypothetical protein
MPTFTTPTDAHTDIVQYFKLRKLIFLSSICHFSIENRCDGDDSLFIILSGSNREREV